MQRPPREEPPGRHGTRHHPTPGAAIIHPDLKEVPPPGSEPILKDDGASRNDRERNASKRPVGDLRREHSHMKAIVVEDGLASNGPRAGTLMESGFRFMLGAKPRGGGRKLPFCRVESGDTRETWVRRDMKTGATRRFEWDRELPPDDGHFDLKADMHGFERNCGHGGSHQRDVFGAHSPCRPFPVDHARQCSRGAFQRTLRH